MCEVDGEVINVWLINSSNQNGLKVEETALADRRQRTTSPTK
jgi:hypothetical protein